MSKPKVQCVLMGNPPEVGSRVLVTPSNHYNCDLNGRPCLTTMVWSVTGNTFETSNTIYEVVE